MTWLGSNTYDSLPVVVLDYRKSVNTVRHVVELLYAVVRDDVSLPAICIELADSRQRKYRMRCGVHRYHASLTLGFSHLPAKIIERMD